jgi:D-aminopeptidase
MTRICAILFTSLLAAAPAAGQQAGRARALGIVPGTLPAGPDNAITDVMGVRMGQTTVGSATPFAPG